MLSRALQEDEKLLHLRGQHNLSFAKIAEKIEGRSYNDVKNRWSQISRQIAALKVGSPSIPVFDFLVGMRLVLSSLGVFLMSSCEHYCIRLRLKGIKLARS